MPDQSLMSRKRVDWVPITGGTRFIMNGTLLGAPEQASVFAISSEELNGLSDTVA
jgi:hypothetical protein